MTESVATAERYTTKCADLMEGDHHFGGVDHDVSLLADSITDIVRERRIVPGSGGAQAAVQERLGRVI